MPCWAARGQCQTQPAWKHTNLFPAVHMKGHTQIFFLKKKRLNYCCISPVSGGALLQEHAQHFLETLYYSELNLKKKNLAHFSFVHVTL